MAGSRLLKALPANVAEGIIQRADRPDFKRGDVLLTAREPARFVYFPTSCLASMVVTLENGSTVEAATVGNDGFVGISSFLGMDRAEITTLIQIAGEALRLPVERFRELLEDLRTREVFGAFVGRTMSTIAQSAACNALHPVHERLARWLLMVCDSTDRSEFPLTQEFIAVMLGVHRPTVTIAIRLLESANLIEHRRGLIRILDPEELAAAACECYRLANWDRTGR